MSRRTTLAPVSGNASKIPGPSKIPLPPSLAAASASKPPLTSSMLSSLSKNRMTMAASVPSSRPSTASSMSRRSSVLSRAGMLPGASAPRPDSRNLNERPFMSSCASNILEFLTTNGYPSSISQKVLLNPLTKDFTSIFEFLIGRVDPMFKLKPGKLEEEVPMIMKFLGYPFIINKRTLQSVGTPHTWPTLLAALSWLVDILKYQDRLENFVGEPSTVFATPARPTSASASQMDGVALFGSQDMDKDGKVFFNWLTDAYQKYVSGNEELDQMEQRLQDLFDAKDHTILASMEKYKESMSMLQMEIEGYAREQNRLEEMKNKVALQQSDKAKFGELMAHLAAAKETTAQKLEERKDLVIKSQREIAEIEAERKLLQSQIDAQPISSQDVERMTKEKQAVDDVHKSVVGKKERLLRENWESDLFVSKKTEEIHEQVNRYNVHSKTLKIAPKMAKYAEGLDLELVFDREESQPKNMVDKDIRNFVLPALVRVKEAMQSRVHDVQEAVVTSQEQADKIDDDVAEKLELIEHVESKLTKAEARFEQQKMAMQEDLKKILDEAEYYESETAKSLAQMQAQVVQSEKHLEAMLEDFTAHKRRCEIEKQDLSNAVLSLMDILVMHKKHISDNLADLEQAFADALYDVRGPFE